MICAVICCFVEFDTSIICHVPVYCFGSFLLQDLFLSLQVFAFKGQNIKFTVNVLLTILWRRARLWLQLFASTVGRFVSQLQGVNNRWNRWSENQSIIRWQSMPINRLISIIDEQTMLKFYVIIDFIDYQFLSIINTNRSVNLHRLSSIGFHFLCVLFSVKIFKTRSLYASNNSENCDKTLIFFTTVILIHRGEHGHTIL